MAKHPDPNAGGTPEPAVPQGRQVDQRPAAVPQPAEPMTSTNNAGNNLSAPLRALLPERHLGAIRSAAANMPKGGSR